MLRLNLWKRVLLVFSVFALVHSCSDQLDLRPEDDRLTGEDVFADPESYRETFAKLYAGLGVTGQNTTGEPDIVSDDEGASGYLRAYWKLQEFPTDEAIIGWNDGAIRNLNFQTWTSDNEFSRAAYGRFMYQVVICNNYLRETTDEKLDSRGVDDELRAEIQGYRTEARFLRALAYYHALDLYGNMPFVTEEDPVGTIPEQIMRPELYNYVESELLAIENDMPAPRTNEYGRADRAAVWMTLAKLYLNSDVYVQQSRYNDVIAVCNQIIGSGYSIPSNPYFHSFLADNDRNGTQEEVIFTIPFDGLNTQTYGGTTFLVHAPVGGSEMEPADYGINSGWGGIRTTPEFVELFPGEENSQDQRAMFFTEGQSKEVTTVGTFEDGYAITKWRNLDVNGDIGNDTTGEFADIDFPMYRLADVYLMYAEATLRGGGGDIGTAVGYINELRERAYGSTFGNISSSDLTLEFILDERGRELYWEAHRRTDLVRFGEFSTSGVWAWKGNVPNGTTTEIFRNLYPIPANDVSVNPNLTQNPGYN